MKIIEEIKKLDLEDLEKREDIIDEIEKFEDKEWQQLIEEWENLDVELRLKVAIIFNDLYELPFIFTELLNKETNDRVLASLIKACSKIRDEKIIPLLAEFLKHPDRRIRANAVESLAIFNSIKIKELLLPLLEDKDNRVKANTAVALWKFPEIREKVREIFNEMLNDEDKWMKASAQYAFGEIGQKEFLEQMEQSLFYEDPDVSKNAFVALLTFADKIDEKEEN